MGNRQRSISWGHPITERAKDLIITCRRPTVLYSSGSSMADTIDRAPRGLPANTLRHLVIRYGDRQKVRAASSAGNDAGRNPHRTPRVRTTVSSASNHGFASVFGRSATVVTPGVDSVEWQAWRPRRSTFSRVNCRCGAPPASPGRRLYSCTRTGCFNMSAAAP